MENQILEINNNGGNVNKLKEFMNDLSLTSKIKESDIPYRL